MGFTQDIAEAGCLARAWRKFLERYVLHKSLPGSRWSSLASSREGEEALFIAVLRALGAQALKVQGNGGWLIAAAQYDAAGSREAAMEEQTLL